MTTNPRGVDLNQAVLDGTADAMIAADSTGKIVLWNPAAEQLLGYRQADAVGKTLALIIPPAYRPAHMNAFHRAMNSGAHGHCGRAGHRHSEPRGWNGRRA